MKRLLLPIDGSDCSQRAVEYVLAKRAHYRAPDDLEIHLLNVQPPLSGDVTQFVGAAQVAEFHRSESERVLARARARLDEAGARYTVHARVGRIADTIVALADSLGCDQVVMGTHGRGALADLIVGSTSIRVLHLVKVPLVLIK